MPVRRELADQRNITHARFAPAVRGETFGPLERAVDDRHIQLHAEVLVESVTGEHL